MSKKVIFSLISILILVVAAGGFFWWWQNQKDVRELNKNLPGGVRVVKSLFGKEYKVVNKLDGYEFKVPEEWGGVKDVKYFEEEEEKRGVTGLALEEQGGEGRSFGIILHKLNRSDIKLEAWVREQFQKFELSEAIQLKQFKVNNFDIIQVKAEKYFTDFAWYFFKKDQKIYEIDSVSEKFIREIIPNGKW